MTAFYNENDPKAAAWLRELMAAGLIAPGVVDERSIADVKAEEVAGRTRCHWFAGIAGWDYAIQLAGWHATRPVWTGSCPCQPFSAAGKRKGQADERHLWPEFRRLIAACRPPVIFGEQVASSDGREWFGGRPGMQRVSDAQAVERVLQAQGLYGRLPAGLQGMLQGAGADAQGEHTGGTEDGGIQAVEEDESGEGVVDAGEAQGQAERTGVQLGRMPGVYSRCHRCGRLRIDGHPVQSGWWENVGQPLARQDRLQPGLFAGKCPCGAVLRERDGEHLGREQDRGNRGRHHGEPAEPLGELAGSLGIRIESPDRYPILSGVRNDLEALGYAVGCADLPACSAGAPHIRQRLFWVASLPDAARNGTERRSQAVEGSDGPHNGVSRPHGRIGDLSHPGRAGLRERGQSVGGTSGGDQGAEGQRQRIRGDAWHGGVLGDPPESEGQRHRTGPVGGGDCEGQGEGRVNLAGGHGPTSLTSDAERPERRADGQHQQLPGGREQAAGGPCGPVNIGDSFWSRFDIIHYRDGKARRVESGTFPLADGVPGRVGLLRGYGNAIVPAVAAKFIQAFLQSEADQ